MAVIIPIHNGGPALADSVEGVLEQAQTDTEIIVVDDASTDGSVDAFGEVADVRVHVIRLRENCGPAAARNAGARAAASTWLMFLDSDDHLLPHALELRSFGVGRFDRMPVPRSSQHRSIDAD